MKILPAFASISRRICNLLAFPLFALIATLLLANAPAFAQDEMEMLTVEITTTAAPIVSAVFPVTITFSEPVTGFEIGDITVVGGNVSTGSFTSDADDGAIYNAMITPATAGAVTVNVLAGVAMDQATPPNPNVAADILLAVTYTTLTVEITTPALAVAAAFPVTITFSDPVTGFVIDDIFVDEAVVSDFTGSDGDAIYSATITPDNLAVMTQIFIDVAGDAAMDTATPPNPNAAAEQLAVTYTPAAALTVEITTTAAPIVSAVFPVTITFSEPVTGFEIGDITVVGGNVSAGSFTSDADDGAIYNAMITPTTAGAVTVNVLAGVAMDQATPPNPNVAADILLAVTYTTLTVEITTPALAVAAAFPVTITFSDPVTGFVIDDIFVDEAVVSDFTGSDGDAIYSATITPDNLNVMTRIFIDVAGDAAMDAATPPNPNAAAEQLAVTYTPAAADTTAPTVTITTPALAVSAAFLVTITFNEPVTGFVIDDVLVDEAVVSDFTGSDGDAIYSALITPDNLAVMTQIFIDVADDAAIDAATNGNTAAEQVEVTYTPPAAITVTAVDSTTADGNYNTGDIIEISITLSGQVTVTGSPQLQLETGIDERRLADYQSGTGSDTLLFRYTVMAGDGSADLDYTGSDALTLNGGTILRLTTTTSAVLTLPAPGTPGSLSANSDISLGSIVTAVDSTTADGNYDIDDIIEISVTFNQPVTVSGTPILALATGSADRQAIYQSGSGSATLNFQYTIIEGDSSTDLAYIGFDALTLGSGGDTSGGTIQDAAGNNAILNLPIPGSPGSLSANSNIRIGTNVEVQTARLNDTVLTQVTQAVATATISAITQRISGSVTGGTITSGSPSGTGGTSSGGATPQVNIAGASSLEQLAQQTILPMLQGNELNLTANIKQLLANSSFLIPLNAAGDSKSGRSTGQRQTSIWGSGDYTNLSDDDNGLDYDGDSYGFNIGIDTKMSDTVLLGLGLNWSDSNFDYNDSTTNQRGDYDYQIFSLNPYISWSPLSSAGNLWATIGYGIGDIESRSGDTVSSTETTQYQLASGGKYRLFNSADSHTQLNIKGDISASRVEIDQSTGFASADINTQTLRLLLEGSTTIDGGGYRLVRSLETGIRYDLGDGDTGSGIELSPALTFQHKASNLILEARGRYLIAGQYDLWGANLLARIDLSSRGRGLRLSITPGWGQSDSPTDQVLANNTSRINSDIQQQEIIGQLSADISYGLALPAILGQPLLLTPYAELAITTSGNRLNIGQNLTMGDFVSIKMALEQKQRQDDTNEYQLWLRQELRF